MTFRRSGKPSFVPFEKRKKERKKKIYFLICSYNSSKTLTFLNTPVHHFIEHFLENAVILFCQDGKYIHGVARWLLRTLLIEHCCFLEIMF